MNSRETSVKQILPLFKKKKNLKNYRRKFRAQFGRKPVLKAISIIKEKKKKYTCPVCSYEKK